MAMEDKSPGTRTKSFKSRWMATAWPRSMGWTMDDSVHINLHIFRYIYIIYQHINQLPNLSISQWTYQVPNGPAGMPRWLLSPYLRTCSKTGPVNPSFFGRLSHLSPPSRTVGSGEMEDGFWYGSESEFQRFWSGETPIHHDSPKGFGPSPPKGP